MNNLRKGRVEELLGHSAGRNAKRSLPAARALASRPKISAIGRGRHYFAPPTTAPAECAPTDLESLLETLFAGTARLSQQSEDEGSSDSLLDLQQPIGSETSSEDFVHNEPDPVVAEAVTFATVDPAPHAIAPANTEPAAVPLAESSQFTQLKFAPIEFNTQSSSVSPSTTFLGALLATTEKRKHEISAEKDIHTVPPPVRTRSRAAAPPALTRAWEWIRKNQKLTTRKQLRVSDTVGLGDKRFVALLHFEGRKFLIGGGGSNVSLLSELGEPSTVSGSVIQTAALPESAE